jgi:hypothetical protein
VIIQVIKQVPCKRHLFVYDAIGFVVPLLIQLSGGLNVLRWFNVAVYLFFTVSCGYQLLWQWNSL